MLFNNSPADLGAGFVDFIDFHFLEHPSGMGKSAGLVIKYMNTPASIHSSECTPVNRGSSS